MTRTARFIRGVGLGYVYQVVLTIAGLWLTPFLLHSLGRERYGLWVVATQVLVYLGLIDFGITAVVPRTVAAAVGRVKGTYSDAGLAEIVAATLRIVTVQTLIGAVVAAGVIVFLPSEWAAVRIPLVGVLAVFVLIFPCRVAQGVLAGLQDTSYLGLLQLVSWLVGTAVTVVLVVEGHGISSLAAGWSATQTCLAIGWTTRLWSRFRDAVPTRFPPFSRSAAMEQLRQGGWVSVAQVAQTLVAGADILLIGKMLGPESVVVYSITGKLVSVLANQPQILMQAAVPGLSEMRTSASPSDILRASSALTQGMLLLTGLVFCVVMAVNHAFVLAWVGNATYGGLGLTALLLVGMLLRHLSTGAIYTIFSFGRERRIAIVHLCDGVVSASVALVLVPIIGINGAALALIIGVTLVSLPGDYSALLSVTGTRLVDFLRPCIPWFVRFVPLAIACYLLQRWWLPGSLLGVAALAVGVAAIYLLVMRSVLSRPPLAPYIPQRIRRLAFVALRPARNQQAV